MPPDRPPRTPERPASITSPRTIEEASSMSEAQNIPSSRSEPALGGISETSQIPSAGDSTHASSALSGDGYLSSSPDTSGYSRSGSFSASSKYDDDDDESFVPPDRLTIFDMIENLALPQRLEQFQRSISEQKTKLQRQQQRLKSQGMNAKDLVIDEWRRRVPTADEQLEKYKKRMHQSVDRLGQRWNDSKAVTAREKLSFIAGVLNIFISGYLIGAHPEWFPAWYSAQLLYFMPIRYYTYHKKGYHYFLADLCYFTNFLLFLSIWIFPNSKRLFISSYCLAFGNNAVAIAMWRNSLVFHSLDKVTSLFIHIMPCAALHCMVHLIPASLQLERFPAVHTIIHSAPDSPEHYTLRQMVIWATVPYAIWQLSYHFLITVRRRDKIAAGRPTSFTWLRKSYGPTLIGKAVLSLPDAWQEPAFMLIQYSYAVLTMVPCPIWFWYRWASSGFLMTVFIWSIYNGANYYIEVFGKRFQKELDQLKRDVAKWQNSPDFSGGLKTPNEEKDEPAPKSEGAGENSSQKLSTGAAAGMNVSNTGRSGSFEAIPLLDDTKGSSGAQKPEGNGELRERK
ncbi:putative membrane protein [Lasiodiplodia hormozganensis]|uniref:Glycerophosphocholine acyltransferase 1 n=1 Tax=Lasiodiplodia hormozganensis TaxID=869390 RepID=A0AA40D6K3_9PEZI|nr:putative membrane protein [Lasiodiplodia hormozganensis]